MRARALIVLALVALPLTGCGGDSEPAADKSTAPATAPADPAAATTEVKANWAAFFDGSRPAADRATLVQDGETMAQALALGAKDPNAAKTRAAVATVAFSSPTEAAVTYDLLVAGTAVLKGAQGNAVLDDGQWKVSKRTFCQLLALGSPGTPVPGCA